MIPYDKLVRDRIPEIIEAEGKRCQVRVLDEGEYARRLDEKLAEELQEYRWSGDVEELVDLVEVVRAIVEARGVDWDEVERRRVAKREARGGFGKRLLLQGVTDGDEKARPAEVLASGPPPAQASGPSPSGDPRPTGADSATRDRLHTRLRRSPHPFSVAGSLPVLFFGDLLKASIVTVGLNPSDREYLDRGRKELTGTKRRFETLASLGADRRETLTSAQCEQALATMRAYYRPGKPVYGWFRSLDRVVQGMGFRYDAGEVAHLDLVQEATSPTWSALRDTPGADVDALLASDLPFLRWQLETFSLRAAVCNGRTVFDKVCLITGAEIVETGTLKRLRWSVARTDLAGRPVGIAGWNIPLARPTGLDTEGHVDLGRLLAQRLRDLHLL